MDINLYLVGFMGTGKSTVGRQVARQMGFEFIDSDHEIERRQGQPVSQIFAEQGEAKFRALEREFIEHGHPAQKCVVSCGGGLVVPTRNEHWCVHGPGFPADIDVSTMDVGAVIANIVGPSIDFAVTDVGSYFSARLQ